VVYPSAQAAHLLSIVFGAFQAACPSWPARAGLGSIDWVGIVLALGILFWIPTHIMTSICAISMIIKRPGADLPACMGRLYTRHDCRIQPAGGACDGAAALGIGMAWGLMRMLWWNHWTVDPGNFYDYPTHREINFGLFK
jgi:hypothetical protein